MATRSTHTPGERSELAPPAREWFKEFLSPAGIDGVVGMWLLLAPFALVFADADPSINDIALGVLIAAAGFIRLGDALQTRTLAVINGASAVWLLVAAVWLDHSAPAKVNDIAIAAILCALAVAAGLTSRHAR